MNIVPRWFYSVSQKSTTTGNQHSWSPSRIQSLNRENEFLGHRKQKKQVLWKGKPSNCLASFETSPTPKYSHDFRTFDLDLHRSKATR